MKAQDPAEIITAMPLKTPVSGTTIFIDANALVPTYFPTKKPSIIEYNEMKTLELKVLHI